MTSTCDCGKPCDGSFICPSCSKAMEIALGNISAYWADLDTVKGRQTRYGGSGGGRGGEKPLPVDLRFLGAYEDGSRLQDACKNTISTWVRVVMEDKPVIHGPVHPACLHVTCSTARRSRLPADTVASCCLYLLGHADWIRTMVWAPEILDELDNLEAQLRRMVDRPADREYIGNCDECSENLYRKPDSHKAKCRHCLKEYDDAADRRLAVMGDLNDHYLTAAEIELAFTDIGRTPLTAARVRKWAQRDRLVARGHAIVRGKEHPTYLVADVANLLAQDSEQKAG